MDNAYVIASDVQAAKFSPDGNYIALGYKNSSVVIINANTYATVTEVPLTFQDVKEIDFSSDSSKMLVCGKKNANGYEIFSVPAWTQVHSDFTYSDEADSCRFANDGHYAVGTKDGFINYYDSGDNLVWFNRRTTDSKIDALAFSPNSSYLLASWSTNSRKIAVFNVNSNTSEINLTSTDIDI